MTNPYQVMPPLSADEREALKADIALRGVMVPVEYDEHSNVLDGHHRIELCGELGITQWPRLVRYGLSETEKRRHARRLNLDRRHLTTEAKRTLIAEDLKEEPDASNRKIASGLGVDDKTVATVRTELESTAEIPQLDARKGRDGKSRKIVQFIPSTPEEKKGLLISAKEVNEENRTTYRETGRAIARELSDATALQPAGRKFGCLYADPAWKRKAGFGNRSYDVHYGTMDWPTLCAMPVKERLLPDAWGFVWIPRAHLLAAIKVEVDTPLGSTEVEMPLSWALMKAWGFDSYSTCFVWTKTDEDSPDDHGLGLIAWDQDELLLLFKRGRGLPKPHGIEKHGSNHRERAGCHSAKPHYYREMINDMTGGVPVLELFAREDDEHILPPNFYTWGNQSKNTAELPPHDPESGEISEAVDNTEKCVNQRVILQ